MKHNRYALTLLFCILLCGFSNKTFSQITLTQDPTTCGDTAIPIHAVVIGDVPTSAGITADDGYSGCINIGFSFTFYGNTYTSLNIGSNGMLTMGCTHNGAYCPWPISAALLGNSSAYNSICGPWSDICTPCATPGGTITYSSIGTAPYRKFMATWCHVTMYGCTTQYETFQIIIYETTNIAETHIAHRTTGCTWNGGYAIVGVQNATGSNATAAPGRDYPSLWGCINEAWRFTPSGSPITTYTCSSIPFAPVPYSSSTVYWYDSATGVLVGSGPTLYVHPTVPTTYKATAAGCSDSTISYIHVLPLGSGSGGGTGGGGLSHPVNITYLTATDPTDCGKPDGTVTLHGVNPFWIDTVFSSLGGIPQPNIVTSALSDSTVLISGLAAGYYDYFYVKEGNCISNSIAKQLYNPAVSASFTYVVRPGCVNDSVILVSSDSTVKTNPLDPYPRTIFSAPAGYTATFDYGDATTSSMSGMGSDTYSPTHTYPTPIFPATTATYNITLNYGNAYGCTATAVLPVTLGHPLTSTFAPSAPSVCLGVPVAFANTSYVTIAPATYAWTFGDGGTSTMQTPTHTYAAPGTYMVELSVIDGIGCTATSNTFLDVVSINTAIGFHDTTVCLRTPLQLNSIVDVVPASLTDVTYQWLPATNLTDATIPNPLFMVGGVGDFTYTLTATVLPLGCTATDVVTIHSRPALVLTNVTVDQVIPIGGSVQLNADSGWIYVWSPNDGTLTDPNINNPIATPVDSVTTYMVVGMSPYGCRDSATVTIRVDPTVTEFIPEAFTPNGDGLNDVFRVYNLGVYQKIVEFRIFNRWGHEVFSTINPKQGWDGTMNGVPQDMGTYFYSVIVSHPDGQTKNITGSVTLIR